MDALTKLMTSLFGAEAMKGGLGGILGSESMGNLIKGGTSLYNANQMGDSLDFQKDLATNAEARTDLLFDQDQETRERRQNLKFT